jgi:hypothetical protein
LPAGGLQHFLVLLLAHPLTAFFDQRAHVWRQVSWRETLHVNIGIRDPRELRHMAARRGGLACLTD